MRRYRLGLRVGSDRDLSDQICVRLRPAERGQAADCNIDVQAVGIRLLAAACLSASMAGGKRRVRHFYKIRHRQAETHLAIGGVTKRSLLLARYEAECEACLLQ